MFRSKRSRPMLGVLLMSFGLGFANLDALPTDIDPPGPLDLWLAKMTSVVKKVT